MHQQRPVGVLVIAILLLIFGGLGLMMNVCGGAIQLMGGAKTFTIQPPPGGQAPPDVEAMMRARVPYYRVMEYGGPVLGLISGTVMIVSGLGLLRMRRWARWSSIIYAGYNLISTIGNFVFSVIVVMPITKDYMAEVAADPKMPPQVARIFEITMAMTTAMMYAMLLVLAFPIAILIVMFHPRVRAAFQAKPPDQFADEDDTEEPLDVLPAKLPEDGIKPGDDPVAG